MKLISYYDRRCGNKNDLKLIEVWKKAWTERGFEPIVVNEDFVKHPLKDMLEAKIARFPSVNPITFERPCFVRWMVPMMFNERVALMDYDVIPTKNLKGIPLAMLKVELLNDVFTNMTASGGPGFVVGTAQDFIFFVQYMLAFDEAFEHRVNGQIHISDMVISLAFKGWRKLNMVTNCNEPLWWKENIIHYQNSYCPNSIRWMIAANL